MNLLTKINRTYLKYGILVFLIADIVIISISNLILKDELDQQLSLEAELIAEAIQEKGDFINVYPTDIAEEISYSNLKNESSKDTLIYEKRYDELVPYRELRLYKSINGKHYQIITRQMLMELDDIFSLYTALISTVLGLIFILVFLFTHKMNSILWGTFNKNVKLLKNYSFNSSPGLNLKATGIKEFDDLNNVITKMSERLENDYKASKEFSANAAHELQTPLSIIKSKCELLFSNQQIEKTTIDHIHDIYLSTERLSGITKALLLLAKIDHGQFQNREIITLKDIFDSRLEFLQDIIDDSMLHVKFVQNSDCKVNMDKRLANILVQNLINNALNHSKSGENIVITLNAQEFSISNYGEKAINQPELIFNRFYKESNDKNSTGIGLAIVKKISDHYGMTINYSFENAMHTFSFTIKES